MRVISTLAGIALLWQLSGHATAALIQNSLEEFTLFAGNKLVAGKQTTINGQTGSGSDMRLGRLGRINGDLFAKGRLSIGSDSGIAGCVISASDLTIGSRSRTLSVSGGGDVHVNKHVIVDGTLAYGTKALIHPLAHVRDNLSTDLDIWNLLPASSLLPNFAAAVVQDGFTLRQDRQLSLSPSTYGNVRLDNNAVLYLSAGEYHFQNLILGANAQIIANTAEGPVLVNVLENLKSQKSSVLFSADETQLTFNTGRNLSLGQANKVFAMLNSANNMKVGNRSIITGSLVAGNNLRLGKDLEVNRVKVDSVPEPTTLALMAAAFTSLLVRRRTIGVK